MVKKNNRGSVQRPDANQQVFWVVVFHSVVGSTHKLCYTIIWPILLVANAEHAGVGGCRPGVCGSLLVLLEWPNAPHAQSPPIDLIMDNLWGCQIPSPSINHIQKDVKERPPALQIQTGVLLVTMRQKVKHVGRQGFPW